MACSSAKAVEWDEVWAHNLDPSGRAALGVHESSYEECNAGANNGSGNGSIDIFSKMRRM